MSHCVWIAKTEDAASTWGLLGLWWVNGFLLGSNVREGFIGVLFVSECVLGRGTLGSR